MEWQADEVKWIVTVPGDWGVMAREVVKTAAVQVRAERVYLKEKTEVNIANSFCSSHQQSVLQSTTFRPGCPSHFQVCYGWGNPAETSCFAKLTAGVMRKRN